MASYARFCRKQTACKMDIRGLREAGARQSQMSGRPFGPQRASVLGPRRRGGSTGFPPDLQDAECKKAQYWDQSLWDNDRSIRLFAQ